MYSILYAMFGSEDNTHIALSQSRWAAMEARKRSQMGGLKIADEVSLSREVSMGVVKSGERSGASPELLTTQEA